MFNLLRSTPVARPTRQELESRHQAKLDTFRFECALFGGFLRIITMDGDNAAYRAFSLTECKSVQLRRGQAPSTSGTARFKIKITGCAGGAYTYELDAPMIYQPALVLLPMKTEATIYEEDGFAVPGWADGIAMVEEPLYVPAGKGREVRDAILEAIRAGWR